MGCITSRGYSWPPKPYPRFIVRNVTNAAGSSAASVEEIDVSHTEDYVWVYPGQQDAHVGGRSDITHSWTEEASPAQEIAIRCLEDNM